MRSTSHLSQATISLAQSKTRKLIVVDLLPDVLVQRKAAMTRRWSEEFIVKRKSERNTVRATLNPLVASKEETQTIDLFDGEIEIYEKELRERARRFLFVTKMYGRRYSDARQRQALLADAVAMWRQIRPFQTALL